MRLASFLLVACTGAAAAQSVPQWQLSRTPLLEIGDESNTQTQFDGVVGVLRMPRGEIVVGNGFSQELRVFSATGDYLRTLGAPGSAGALRSINRIWRAGDTIVVAEWLPAESRIHRFTTTGYIGRRDVGAANAGGIVPVGHFADGRVVISASGRGSATYGSGILYKDSLPVGVMSLDDRADPRWIGALSSEKLVVPGFSGGGRSRDRGAPATYILGRSEMQAVSGSRLWIADTETGAAELYNSVGRRVAEFTLPIPQRPLDTLTLKRQRMAALTDAFNWNDRAQIDAAYAVPFPKFAPRFTRLVPGVDGEMWLEMFSEDRDAPRPYVVVGQDGAARAVVMAPPGVTPLDFGRDYMLGVRRGEDGAQRVVRYSLSRR